MAALPVDDNDLNDAALWAVIDSAAAASYSSSSSPNNSRLCKSLALKQTNNFRSPPQLLSPLPPHSRHTLAKTPSHSSSPDNFRRPQKIPRSSFSCVSEMGETSSPHLAVVKHCPIMPVYSSPQSLGKFVAKEFGPYSEEDYLSPQIEYRPVEDKDKFVHCLAGSFPTVSVFKNYQDAAMSILEKSDYTMISGNPYIRKSGWRKIAFYFNVSFEIKDKTIQFDENHNVQRAEFIVRASMQGGRFSDGWGSCERREKKFNKPNNDIPSTAETRAKNKACQDLLGIGQYRPGVTHGYLPSPR